MAYFRCCGGGGAKVIIDGEEVNENMSLVTNCADIKIESLPSYADHTRTHAVVYNNELHLLGLGANRNKHYKWNGLSWTYVSELPKNGADTSVVFHNSIFITVGAYFYRFDGYDWNYVNSPPMSNSGNNAVVYNNELHLLGNNYHYYKYDGNSWTMVSTIPYPFTYGCAVVYDGDIHILGSYYSNDYYTYHYKWNGSSWTKMPNTNYGFYYGSCAVLDNKIHILGNGDNVGNIDHSTWATGDSNWTKQDDLDTGVLWNSAVVYNDEINLFGSKYGGNIYGNTHRIINAKIYREVV